MRRRLSEGGPGRTDVSGSSITSTTVAADRFVRAVALPFLGAAAAAVIFAAVEPAAALSVDVAFFFVRCFDFRLTVLPSIAPRIASRLSMYSQNHFHTAVLSRRSTKCSRTSVLIAWMSPSNSLLLRVSECIEIKAVIATISTGANVCTPRRYLLLFVNVSGSASMRSLKVFQTLARCDLSPSSTAPLLLRSLGRCV